MKLKPKYARLVVVGSVGFDHIMRMEGKFSEFILPDMIEKLNVSFTVDSFQKEFRGTGGNCCYGLGVLGVQSYIVSTFGKDAHDYLKHLHRVGVNTGLARVSDEALSAQGFVVSDGVQNQIQGYFPGAMSENTQLSIKTLSQESDLVALLPADPNSFELFVQEVVELKRDFVFDPAFFIANLSKETLLLGLEHAKYIFGNEYEIELLKRKTVTTIDEWLHTGAVVITTLGEGGSVVQTADKKLSVPAVKKVKVVDPTGAGDAYRAGFLAGIMAGQSLEKCAKMGSDD